MWTKGILMAAVGGLLLVAVDDASARHHRRCRRGCGYSSGGYATTCTGYASADKYAPVAEAGGPVAPEPPTGPVPPPAPKATPTLP